MTLGQFIKSNGKKLLFGKGKHIFLQGEKDQSLYLINHGLLKAYYLLEDGKENIKSFMFAGDVVGSMTAAHGQGECSFSLICLRDSEIIEISFERLFEEIKIQPDLARSAIELLLEFSMKKERREYELLCLSAEQRYKLLLERSPDITQYVTQNDIARYLGITPVALSRIRKRIVS